MPHVLLVCTANICRSPMVAAILHQRLAEEEIPGDWQVGSAGTWGHDGQPASEYGVAVMAERSLDTSSHRSQVINRSLMEQADLVLTMTAGHAESLRSEFPDMGDKVYRLTEMAGRPYDVEDPYGSSLSRYQRTVAELEMLIDRGLPRIVELAQGSVG